MRQALHLLPILLVLGACAAVPPEPQPVFRHDFGAAAAAPWTDAGLDNEPGKFTFAVFSDLTGGEREGVFSVAVEQLRLLRPELIVNVGDLVEGGDAPRSQLQQEWDYFDARAGRAHAKVFYTGGNHDLTSALQREIWAERYGRHYYHYTLFLVLDTEDNPPEVQRRLDRIRNEAELVFDQGGWDAWEKTEYARSEERRSGRVGPRQAAYFREVIARYPQARHTFLLMHKPAWERPDEENFRTVEAALADRPYTVFHGHVHAYDYQQRHGRDYIRLGTTGGVQNRDSKMAFDHVTLVTVSDEGVDIANLRLDGVLDKTGKIPAGGEALCFEAAVCGE
jgi:predicted phosphodiesterase